MKSQKQTLMLGLIAAIVVAGGVYLYMSRNQAVAPDSNNTDSNINLGNLNGNVPNDSNTSNPTIPTSDTIAVSTQVSGDSITVDNAFLEKAGYISIHEVDSKGKPTTVIGSSGLLGVGAKQDLEIKAMVKSGSKYIAMLRVDNGDKKFNVAQDPAVTKDGIAVMTLFDVSQ